MQPGSDPRAVLFRCLLLTFVTAVASNPAAQSTGALSIDTLMATPFPTDLVAAPAGGRIAWVSSQSGVNNIWISEPPAHKARAVTTYASDDGQWITEAGMDERREVDRLRAR